MNSTPRRTLRCSPSNGKLFTLPWNPCSRSRGNSVHHRAEYAPEFRIVIAGISTYPESRANDSYEITVYGERLAREQWTFEQIRVRDKYNVPVYRKYRGRDYPVFKVPPGITTVERSRGTREWRAALFVEANIANRMLAVLSLGREVFASIDERKIDRQRWVRGFSLQTTDPAKE